MRQISVLMLLGAALGMMAPLGAAGRMELQARNQAPPPPEGMTPSPPVAPPP